MGIIRLDIENKTVKKITLCSYSFDIEHYWKIDPCRQQRCSVEILWALQWLTKTVIENVASFTAICKNIPSEVRRNRFE